MIVFVFIRIKAHELSHEGRSLETSIYSIFLVVDTSTVLALTYLCTLKVGINLTVKLTASSLNFSVFIIAVIWLFKKYQIFTQVNSFIQYS